MNFDFSSLNFETLDANVNAYPDLFVNQNGVTFTRKVLEDLGYPAYVLCLLDPKARVFAIRASSFLNLKVNKRALLQSPIKTCWTRCEGLLERSGFRANGIRCVASGLQMLKPCVLI